MSLANQDTNESSDISLFSAMRRNEFSSSKTISSYKDIINKCLILYIKLNNNIVRYFY